MPDITIEIEESTFKRLQKSASERLFPRALALRV